MPRCRRRKAVAAHKPVCLVSIEPKSPGPLPLRPRLQVGRRCSADQAAVEAESRAPPAVTAPRECVGPAVTPPACRRCDPVQETCPVSPFTPLRVRALVGTPSNAGATTAKVPAVPPPRGGAVPLFPTSSAVVVQDLLDEEEVAAAPYGKERCWSCRCSPRAAPRVQDLPHHAKTSPAAAPTGERVNGAPPTRAAAGRSSRFPLEDAAPAARPREVASTSPTSFVVVRINPGGHHREACSRAAPNAQSPWVELRHGPAAAVACSRPGGPGDARPALPHRSRSAGSSWKPPAVAVVGRPPEGAGACGAAPPPGGAGVGSPGAAARVAAPRSQSVRQRSTLPRSRWGTEGRTAATAQCSSRGSLRPKRRRPESGRPRRA
jgi:hypothetical protein